MRRRAIGGPGSDFTTEEIHGDGSLGTDIPEILHEPPTAPNYFDMLT